MRALALISVALVACNTSAATPRDPPVAASPARPSPPPELTQELTLDAKPVTVDFDYTAPPGVHTLRFHGVHVGVGREHFDIALRVPGVTRPPLTLVLRMDGEVVATNDARSRCSEDDVGPPRQPTCTLRVARGSTRSTGEHDFDLELTNEGPALATHIAATLMDPAE